MERVRRCGTERERATAAAAHEAGQRRLVMARVGGPSWQQETGWRHGQAAQSLRQHSIPESRSTLR